jgi:class 3 adenylate cyclase
VLVSLATKTLAEGTDLHFEERGEHTVKGIERPVEVFRLAP